MTKVTDLPRGWALYISDECHGVEVIPMFVHRDGRRRRAMEVATMPEAPELFVEVKRQLDIADSERRSFVSEARVRGLEVARLSLQMALGMYERWGKEMMAATVGV